MVRPSKSYMRCANGSRKPRGLAVQCARGADTVRMLCKDGRQKFCAWTSVRKIALTSASGPRRIPATRTDMIESARRDKRQVRARNRGMSDEGAAQARNVLTFRSAVSLIAAASNSMATFTRAKRRQGIDQQQFTLLCALEQNDGVSQTALVEITGIDRSTLARDGARCWKRIAVARTHREDQRPMRGISRGRKALRGRAIADGRSAHC